MGRPQSESQETSSSARAIRWIGILLLWSVAIILFFRFFPAFKIILLGLLAASSVAAMLNPLVRRLPLRRGLSAAIVGLGFIVVTLGLLALISMLFVKPVQEQIAGWPQLKANMDGMLSYWSQKFGSQHAVNIDALTDQLFAFFSGEKIEQALAKTGDVLAAIVMIGAFVFIGSLYLLTEKPGRLIGPILKMLPQPRVEPMKRVFADLERRLRWWLLGTLIGMVTIGIASYVGYRAVGLRYAVPLALFAAVAEGIPTVGPLVTLLLALLLAATQGTAQIIGVSVVYGIVQTLESYVLIPLVMRRAVQVPPVVTLFSIVLWGKIFGLAGLLLAIPIDLVIWSLLDHFLIRDRS